MSNLYEILEVSEKASKEVIDKAYHVLAKKYHPDLQKEVDKKNAENKMKQINEAYEILGNEEKRKQYDKELQIRREEQKLREQVEINEQRIQQEMYNAQREQIKRDEYEKERQRKIQEQEYNNMQNLQNEMKRAYAQAYNDYWRSRGYKIKEPWTLKRLIELLKVLGILAIIIAVIWFFPPTNKILVQFYQENQIIKTIIDIIGSIIPAIWNGIITFFKNTFKF